MADSKTGVARWNESEGTPARNNTTGAETKRRKVGLGFLCVLTIALVICFMPLPTTIKRGLYLKGGNTATLEATTAEGDPADPADVSAALPIISRRLNALGVTESKVTSDGTQISLSVPEDTDAKDVANSIGTTGVIEFIDLEEIGDADALELLESNQTGVQLKRGTYDTILDSEHVVAVEVSEVTGSYWYVSMEFDDEGAEIIADATEEIAKNQGSIAVALDGRVFTIAGVSERLQDNGVNVPVSGGEIAAKGIKACFDTGLLPVSATVGEIATTGALLGDNISAILLGVGVALAVVACVFAFARYKKLGLIVGGAGLVYLVWILGLMGIASRVNMYTLTVPAVVAAFVCGIVSLVASIMLVSYFCDHVSGGGSIKGASLSALREGLSVFIWPVVVFTLACVIFLFVPMMMLSEFGQTGVFGVVAGLAAVVAFASTTLRVLSSGSIQQDPASWGLTVVDAKGGDNA